MDRRVIKSIMSFNTISREASLINKQQVTYYRIWQNKIEFWNVLPCLCSQAQRYLKINVKTHIQLLKDEREILFSTDNKDRRSPKCRGCQLCRDTFRNLALNCFPKYRNYIEINECIWSTTIKQCYTKAT